MPEIGCKTGSRMKKALPWVLFLFILLMIISAYSNTLVSPAYLDDFTSFVNVKAFYPHSITLSSLLAIARTRFGWMRFLPDATFALNNYLGHSSLIYFHAVNIFIHILAFFAVLWFVKELLTAEKKLRAWTAAPYELAGFFPLCVAAIWALSPVQTSAVTYLVQRMASMQALFFTLSSACFIKARIVSEKKMRRAFLFYVLCVLFALCAGLSKENSAMLPVILAVIDIWFFDSSWIKNVWAICRKTGWEIRTVAAAVFLASSYYGFFVILPKLLAGYSSRDFTLGQRLLTEARVVVWYMSLMLWPVPSRLAMEHDPRISTSLLSPFATLPAILLIGALLYFAVRFRRRFPVITFGIVWFFLNLVIESTIIPLELVFEHRLYLPSIGFYMAVAAVFASVLRKIAKRLPEVEFAKAACSLLLIAVSFFSIFTFLRNGAWKNIVTIKYDTVEKAPGSPRANADYANTLCVFSQYPEALKYGGKAVRISKKGRESYMLAENAIILALLGEGKAGEAIRNANEFMKKRIVRGTDAGALPICCLNVARACLIEKKAREAYAWVLKALRYTQLTNNSIHNKILIEKVLVSIFTRFTPGEVDPHLAGATELTDLPIPAGIETPMAGRIPTAERPGAAASCKASGPAPWQAKTVRAEFLSAMVFQAHGEECYARDILDRGYIKNSNYPFVKAQWAKWRQEDAQNLAQRKNWDVYDKYVRSPFSLFNFDMAAAYLVERYHLPKLFKDFGDNRIDAALKISPKSRDARLLKAWYLFNGKNADQAARDTEKIAAAEPNNANVWLALGFFLAKAGDNKGAQAALKKVIALYPGYPHRALVEDYCSRLSSGQNITASK